MAATAAPERTKLEELALHAAKVVRECYEHPGKPYSNSDGVQLYSDSVPGISCTRFQGTGTIPLLRRDVVDRLFVGGDRRAQWNLSWEATEVLDEWSSADGTKKFRTFHERLHGALGGMISARDFVEVQVSWHDSDEEGGRSWVAYCSYDDPRKPANADAHYTRATMHPSGSVAMKKSDAEADKSTVFSVVHTAVAGSIPNWLASKGVASELFYFFSNVTKAFTQQ